MALTASAEQGSKRTLIMILVIGMHFLGLWALQNGLARRIVELLPADIQTKIIEEKNKEEPPPPPPPPPDMPVQPPPFIPPPEVSVSIPVETTTAIQAVTTERPPVVIPPVIAQVEATAPRKDPKHPFGNPDEYYPASAKRDGQEGVVTVSLVIGVDGKPTDVKVATSSGFPVLDEAAVRFSKTVRMLPATRNGVAVPGTYDMKIRFRLKQE